MSGKAPHFVQYQGSKRKLAPQILQYMPQKFNRLIEPFAGMAAISIATAMEGRANAYIINDLNGPLVGILREAIESPEQLVNNYQRIWNEQFAYGDNHVQHFYDVRDRFNNGEKFPENLLYLIARCVKGAVRYSGSGNFNQSPDKCRHGTNPNTLAKNIHAISNLLRGKTTYYNLDYREIFEIARPGDLVYMDPPYQGVTTGRDTRYFSGVSFDEFAKAIEILNDRQVNYIISYDGACGGKEYGEDLPKSLGCEKVLLDAGLSSQALLLGKKSITYEALYISKTLLPICSGIPQNIPFEEVIA